MAQQQRFILHFPNVPHKRQHIKQSIQGRFSQKAT